MAWRLMRGVLLVAIACTMTPLDATQQNPAGDRQIFKAQADLVVLYVNVFNERSDAVPNLPQSGFRVFEDDKPQEIVFFSSADVPVAVGLILDNSGSMIGRGRLVLTGSTAFARSSHPEDELFTIHFNEKVQYGLAPATPFTNHPPLLLAAISRYRASGRTALHDAVISGLRHLERASHQKRVLVVLSDGEDNASHYSEDDMIEHARRSDAIVYTVSNADRRVGMAGNAGLLRKLADVTGGVAYFPHSDEAVVESFDEIAGNIRRGYTIGYEPPNVTRDGGFRRVKVMVLVPGRTHLSVRTRDGYRTPDHRSSP